MQADAFSHLGSYTKEFLGPVHWQATSDSTLSDLTCGEQDEWETESTRREGQAAKKKEEAVDLPLHAGTCVPFERGTKRARAEESKDPTEQKKRKVSLDASSSWLSVAQPMSSRLAAQEAHQSVGSAPEACMVKRSLLAGASAVFEDDVLEDMSSDEELQEPPSERVSYVTVNAALARWYASTAVAQSRMFGCYTHSQFVSNVILRMFDEDNGFAKLSVVHRETEMSEMLGLKMRQVSGGAVPREEKAGVQASFQGQSPFGWPRDLRTLFFTAVPHTHDIDLRAAHQQCIARRYPHLQHVKEYGVDCKVVRERIALEMNVSAKAVKSLVTRAAYGQHPKKWLAEFGVSKLSDSAVLLLGDQTSARVGDAAKYPEMLDMIRKSGKRNPAASLHCARNMAEERVMVEAIHAAMLKRGGALVLPMGDGGIVQGPRLTQQLPAIISELAAMNIFVDEKVLPKTKEEYMEFAMMYAKEKGKEPPDFAVVAKIDFAAYADARRCLTTPKSSIDDMQVARSILHLISPNFAKPEGEFKGAAPIEAWIASKQTWLPWSGDDRLRLAVESAVEDVFRTSEWEKTVEHGGKHRYIPSAQQRDPRFGSLPFLSRIMAACSSLLEPMRPLDDEDATSHLIHFECGLTMNLAEGVPFEEQLRPGKREDRISRSTGKAFVEWDATEAVRTEVRQICEEINAGCSELAFSIDGAAPEDVMDALTQAATAESRQQLRDRLVALMPHSKLLQLLFPSYSSWDTVIYELRQYTRGASGCKAFEEFLVFLGRRGSKGTTLKLLRAAFGSSSRQGSMGYCCVQKAKYFEQKDNKNASEPDEGVAAMKGALSTNSKGMGTLTPHWSSPGVIWTAHPFRLRRSSERGTRSSPLG